MYRKVVKNGCAIGVVIICAWIGATVRGDEKHDAAAQKRAWQRLEELAGTWHGDGKGTPGASKVSRTYELILQGKFVLARNTSRFEPAGEKDKGEVHQDLGVYSFDRARQAVVLREFHSEGFVNQYVLESINADATTLTFVTEAVENGPPGFAARVTLIIDGEASLREEFELKFPGADFETCVSTSLSR